MSIKESFAKASERFSALSNPAKVAIGAVTGLALTAVAAAVVVSIVGMPGTAPDDSGAVTEATNDVPSPVVDEATDTTGSIGATETPKAETEQPKGGAAQPAKPAKPKAPTTGGSNSGTKGGSSGGSSSGGKKGGSSGGSTSTLPASKQKAIIADLEAAEKRAEAEATKKYPDTYQSSEYNTYYSELLEGYKAAIVDKHGITWGDLLDVELSRY